MTHPLGRTELDQLIAKLRQHYAPSTAPALGPGLRPVLLVIDFIEGFTAADSPLGGPWDDAIEHTAALLRQARAKGITAIFTTVEYERAEIENNLLVRKAPRVSLLIKGSRWTEVDHRLPRSDTDLVVAKKHGSAFFGTALASQFQMMKIDTLLVAGCVTSGCVRASAVDAAQLGFRALVVREACADRSILAHETNLLDIAARYGDVISAAEARSYLASLPSPALLSG